MRIFVMGAGRMGAWLVEELCLDHEVAVYDRPISAREAADHYRLAGPVSSTP